MDLFSQNKLSFLITGFLHDNGGDLQMSDADSNSNISWRDHAGLELEKAIFIQNKRDFHGFSDFQAILRLRHENHLKNVGPSSCSINALVRVVLGALRIFLVTWDSDGLPESDTWNFCEKREFCDLLIPSSFWGIWKFPK